jgi:DNA mismatch repair protein MutS
LLFVYCCFHFFVKRKQQYMAQVASTSSHTPLMAQYHSIKSDYPDTLLFFQVGDFYELFFDDAVCAARFLSITLTSRGKNAGADIPLCGVPVHALEVYVARLVKGGFSVALCDQMSKPQPGTVVERAVTRVYTPGTLTDEYLLVEKTASYLLAVSGGSGAYGLMVIELLTGQIMMTHCGGDDVRVLEAELARYMPDEVLIAQDAGELSTIIKKWGYTVSPVPALESAARELHTAWIDSSMRAVMTEVELVAAALVHRYVQRVQPAVFMQPLQPVRYEPDQYVVLDAATQRNIAILTNTDEGSQAYTVCRAVDGTVTAMGARLLKKWLVRPLKDATRIAMRHDVVQLFVGMVTVASQVEQVLRQIADIERIVGRIVLSRATRSDYCALRDSLRAIRELPQLLAPYQEHRALLTLVCESTGQYEALESFLYASMYDGPEEEWLIKPGYSAELDEARARAMQGHEYIQQYALQQGGRYEIPSLKVLYTSVAGYFIEITKTHIHKVPDSYKHIQTLAGRERYVTPELSALERSLDEAHEQVKTLEQDLYTQVQAHIKTYSNALRRTASAIATLDVLLGFSTRACAWRYVRPQFSSERAFRIMQGRHPVIEQLLAPGSFVANDVSVGVDAPVWIITGPNMGGKSTYLRQVALISLLAQCGSFVPAVAATLSLVDRIFTRIGAGDNVAQGKSTFLVEMEEAATICQQATERSLVILDEVGRGTSTDDGRVLAQAIIEYLAHTVGALTLFATHYHELTVLAQGSPVFANYHVACIKEGDTLHFLHRIEPGVAQASFGIEVAQLAGLPVSIISRARQLLLRERSE